MSTVFITNNALKCIQPVDGQKFQNILQQFNKSILEDFSTHIDFQDVFESSDLIMWKNHLTLSLSESEEKAKHCIVNDTYVKEPSRCLKFHYYEDCKYLNSDFINVKYPPELEDKWRNENNLEHKKQEYQDWFLKDHKPMFFRFQNGDETARDYLNKAHLIRWKDSKGQPIPMHDVYHENSERTSKELIDISSYTQDDIIRDIKKLYDAHQHFKKEHPYLFYGKYPVSILENCILEFIEPVYKKGSFKNGGNGILIHYRAKFKDIENPIIIINEKFNHIPLNDNTIYTDAAGLPCRILWHNDDTGYAKIDQIEILENELSEKVKTQFYYKKDEITARNTREAKIITDFYYKTIPNADKIIAPQEIILNEYIDHIKIPLSRLMLRYTQKKFALCDDKLIAMGFTPCNYCNAQTITSI